MASSASAVETRSPSTSPIKGNLEAYLKSFNAGDPAEYCKFYAEDIHVHIPAFPPINSRTELEVVFRQGLTFFSETIRPTVFIVGEKQIAMEARMESVANEDIDFKFPFTGETYKKGEEFVYEIMYVGWIFFSFSFSCSLFIIFLSFFIVVFFIFFIFIFRRGFADLLPPHLSLALCVCVCIYVCCYRF